MTAERSKELFTPELWQRLLTARNVLANVLSVRDRMGIQLDPAAPNFWAQVAVYQDVLGVQQRFFDRSLELMAEMFRHRDLGSVLSHDVGGTIGAMRGGDLLFSEKWGDIRRVYGGREVEFMGYIEGHITNIAHLRFILESLFSLGNAEQRSFVQAEYRKSERLSDIVDQGIKIARRSAVCDGIQCVTDIDPAPHVLTVLGDPVILLQNVIKNAALHGQAGKVSFSSHADQGKIRLVVADDGSGIDQDRFPDANEIFGLGVTAQSSSVDQPHGIGLRREGRSLLGVWAEHHAGLRSKDGTGEGGARITMEFERG